jgi:hypothetical protein
MWNSSPTVPDGVTAGFAVFDRTLGAATVHHDSHRRFRAASLVKILIALDRLEADGQDLPAPERARLESMLRASDDDAANWFWDSYGGPEIAKRMITKLRLTESAPPPAGYPGWWGYTAVTAADMVKIYRYVLDSADPWIRDVVMDDLRRSTRRAADGNDQWFGIPSAVDRPWAVKQGWSRFPSSVSTAGSVGGPAAYDLDLTRPAMHTSGTVGADDRRILVVLTLHEVGTAWHESAARITALTRQVNHTRDDLKATD